MAGSKIYSSAENQNLWWNTQASCFSFFLLHFKRYPAEFSHSFPVMVQISLCWEVTFRHLHLHRHWHCWEVIEVQGQRLAQNQNVATVRSATLLSNYNQRIYHIHHNHRDTLPFYFLYFLKEKGRGIIFSSMYNIIYMYLRLFVSQSVTQWLLL